jgi:hypothetical protein
MLIKVMKLPLGLHIELGGERQMCIGRETLNQLDWRLAETHIRPAQRSKENKLRNVRTAYHFLRVQSIASIHFNSRIKLLMLSYKYHKTGRGRRATII